MTMSDPIADMLTRIRNANTAKHDTVDVPSSKMKLAIADILVKEGYIASYEIVDDGAFKNIHMTLKYGADKNEKIITGIKRISKPGLRVYAGKDEIESTWWLRNCNPFHKPGCYHRQRSQKTSGWWRSISICLVGIEHLANASRKAQHEVSEKALLRLSGGEP